MFIEERWIRWWTTLDVVARMWWYRAPQQEVLAQAGVTPITNEQNLLHQYFMDHYRMDIAPEDILLDVGYPLPPPLGWVKLPWSWDEDLRAAVTDPDQVPVVLRTLSQIIDAQLAKQGTGS